MTAALVDEARDWAQKMVWAEAGRSGDLARAMEAGARRAGVTRSLIWSLHYRPPKDVWATAYFKLRGAYAAECARQAKLLDHEIALTAALTGPDSALLRAGAAVAGKALGQGPKRLE